MKLLERLDVAARIAAFWGDVKDLPVRTATVIPSFTVRIGGKRWEFGPIPVRRVQ